MLLIRCPFCAMERPETEFRHAGAAHLARPDEEADDQSWAAFLYLRNNEKGVTLERWRHAAGCGRFFNASRDTVSDQFLAFYKPGEPCPPLQGEGS